MLIRLHFVTDIASSSENRTLPQNIYDLASIIIRSSQDEPAWTGPRSKRTLVECLLQLAAVGPDPSKGAPKAAADTQSPAQPPSADASELATCARHLLLLMLKMYGAAEETQLYAFGSATRSGGQ